MQMHISNTYPQSTTNNTYYLITNTHLPLPLYLSLFHGMCVSIWAPSSPLGTEHRQGRGGCCWRLLSPFGHWDGADCTGQLVHDLCVSPPDSETHACSTLPVGTSR